MPRRPDVHAWDRALIIASFVLLVAIVAFEAWWINNELDHARNERCALAWLEVEVTRLHVDVEDLAPDARDRFDTARVQLEDLIAEHCGELTL